MSFPLVVRVGSRPERVFTASFLVGSRRDIDLSVEGDPFISDAHALCGNFRGDWSVQDLGSVDGTYLNGSRVYGQQWVCRGDVLRVGRTEIVLVPC